MQKLLIKRKYCCVHRALLFYVHQLYRVILSKVVSLLQLFDIACFVFLLWVVVAESGIRKSSWTFPLHIVAPTEQFQPHKMFVFSNASPDRTL